VFFINEFNVLEKMSLKKYLKSITCLCNILQLRYENPIQDAQRFGRLQPRGIGHRGRLLPAVCPGCAGVGSDHPVARKTRDDTCGQRPMRGIIGWFGIRSLQSTLLRLSPSLRRDLRVVEQKAWTLSTRSN